MITEDLRDVYAALKEYGLNPLMPHRSPAGEWKNGCPTLETVKIWTDPGDDLVGYYEMWEREDRS